MEDPLGSKGNRGNRKKFGTWLLPWADSREVMLANCLTEELSRRFAGLPLYPLSLPARLLRVLVFPEPNELRMPQVAVRSPLHEFKLSYEHRM